MSHTTVFAICGLTLAAWARAHPLCEVAEAGVQRLAQARGLVAEVRCRASAHQALPAEASVLEVEVPLTQVMRSGGFTWPVRVDVGNGRSYVQQVPLTVAWTAPAWTATRNLQAGAELQPGDLELQQRRWPEGMAVQAVNAQARPQGRLHGALRAGDILTAAALLPLDALVRGDRVTAVLAQGSIEIRLPAQLLAPTRVGEFARVQVSGRTAPLEGRMVDAQTLMVVSE